MLAKYSKKIGDFGEEIASTYLEKKGYKILNKNINFSNQEVDIIASLKNYFYIIEVKTSSLSSSSKPEDYINQKKLNNLKKAAYQFSRINKIKLENIYFDLIAISIDKPNNKAKIKHYKNIC